MVFNNGFYNNLINGFLNRRPDFFGLVACSGFRRCLKEVSHGSATLIAILFSVQQKCPGSQTRPSPFRFPNQFRFRLSSSHPTKFFLFSKCPYRFFSPSKCVGRQYSNTIIYICRSQIHILMIKIEIVSYSPKNMHTNNR